MTILCTGNLLSVWQTSEARFWLCEVTVAPVVLVLALAWALPQALALALVVALVVALAVALVVVVGCVQSSGDGGRTSISSQLACGRMGTCAVCGVWGDVAEPLVAGDIRERVVIVVVMAVESFWETERMNPPTRPTSGDGGLWVSPGG